MIDRAENDDCTKKTKLLISAIFSYLVILKIQMFQVMREKAIFKEFA